MLIQLKSFSFDMTALINYIIQTPLIFIATAKLLFINHLFLISVSLFLIFNNYEFG